jgi:peptide-methionine (S)-S-oxide reductase
MTQIATLAGGCFWCLESAFNHLRGVERAISGYMGGQVDRPTYEQVCGGYTGHAEVVQVRFDPQVIGFSELLEVFFALHDPTTLNRQGNDVGTQYRSAIFCHDSEQEAQARAMIEQLTAEGAFAQPIVTEVTPAATFWSAEDYHQGYAERNPHQPYCMFVVGPKLAKFRTKFAQQLKPEIT